MNIAIYYPWIYLTSGVERTIIEITKIPGHTYTIFTNHFDKKNTFPKFSQLNVIQLNKVPVKRGIPSVLKAASIITLQKMDLSSFDLLIVHSDGLGDLILTRNHDIPAICICHTPLRPVFDENYRRNLQINKNISYKISFMFFANVFKIVDKFLFPKYSHIFFNSQETLRRAQKGSLLKSIPKNKYSILHPGIDWRQIKPSKTFEKYFLLPGRIMWTKNIGLAIRSFIKFKSDHQNHAQFKLIIAGKVDKKSQGYLAMLQNLSHNRDDIQFIINPTDQQLHRLYQNCWAVLSSAFNEDWGLTLIEGNAHGKPTIAINRGGPTESQIHKKTGLLVNDSILNYSAALYYFASNSKLTKKMGHNARLRSKMFAWHNYVMELYSLTKNQYVN